MSRPRYEIIGYFDKETLPKKWNLEENQKYFGHVVMLDMKKSKVALYTPYNVYHIDPMIDVCRRWNQLNEDRELYLKTVLDYVGHN